MAHVIAVAGKGGVGKTTLCGMLIQYLCEQGKGPVLAVDADANSNLNEVLGVKVETTLGDVREEIAQAEMAQKSPIPAGMSKADYAELRFEDALIEDDDFVYVDAGTTTELLIDFLENREAVYVTNAVSHAKQLAAKGCRVYLLGGEFKGTTEAIVGEEAVASVEKYHFTKGFFGVNGITVEQGFTTPEVREAMIKRKAMEHTGERYILADPSKFDAVSAVTFGSFGDAVILTTAEVPKPYKRQKNVREVEEI